jgi:tyrosine-protein phosphatase
MNLSNLSLVFQLVEFQRSLTTLLSNYVAKSDCQSIQTSFPTLAEQTLSEAEWARKRAEFEAESDEEDNTGFVVSPISPEEAGDEARRLDEAMVQRLREREQAV